MNPQQITVAIGADHGGYALKQAILAHLDTRGIPYRDFGTYDCAAVDYPAVAKNVCTAVTDGAFTFGILVCGTGVGMSMAANKIHGVRAAVCSDAYSVKYTRLHNDANILCLGGRVVGDGLAMELVDLFLSTPFQGGRHAKRVAAVMELEENKF